MQVRLFSPKAAPGASETAVRTVLVKRVPKSGTPSVNTLVKVVTLPVWISAAAALVTAGVTRLVAPVWSSFPQGEALITLVQSSCAKADGENAITAAAADAAKNALNTFMSSSPRRPLFQSLAPKSRIRQPKNWCHPIPG